MRSRRLVALGAAVVAVVAMVVPVAKATSTVGAVQPGDWRTYGGSAHHTFSNATGLTTTNVHTLAP